MLSNHQTTATPPKKELEPSPRRRFLNGVWKLLALIVSLEFAWVFASILRAAHRKRSGRTQENFVPAGNTEDFANSSVTAIPRGQFYLVRQADGSFLALSKTCTHLGCSLVWDEETDRFICPCHRSSFDRSGEVLTPPAVRGLDNYPIRIENGLVLVNVAAPQKWTGAQQNRSVSL